MSKSKVPHANTFGTFCRKMDDLALKYTCVITLFNPETSEDCTTLINKQQIQHQTLLGQTVVSGQVLEDMNGEKTIFFVFPDLSVRIQGIFALRCALIDITRYPFPYHFLPY